MNDVTTSTNPLIYGLAGPGSGKTHTMIERICFLVKTRKVDQSKIVCITYTNVAANEMKTRLLAKGVQVGFVGTLHKFMLKLIRENLYALKRFGYSTMPTILGDEEREAVIDEVCKLHNHKQSRQQVLEEIGKGFKPPYVGRLGLLRKEYYDTLAKTGCVDYDAILFYGLTVVKETGCEFEYLFVDECQDSCEIDWQIYDALTIPNRFFIGDSDQSLYEFRGARPELFEARIAGEAGFKFVLQANYRCTKQICDVANNLIRHNQRLGIVNTVSNRNGPEVIEKRFQNAAAEMNSLLAMFQEYRKQGSVAILAATNEIVNQYALFFESVGVKNKRSAERFEDFIAMLYDRTLFESKTEGDITITTIHGAKGSEYETVFLPAFEQGIIPNKKIEASRRMAYVAITRAKKNLVISHCMQRNLYGKNVHCEPSQFINEMNNGITHE